MVGDIKTNFNDEHSDHSDTTIHFLYFLQWLICMAHKLIIAKYFRIKVSFKAK